MYIPHGREHLVLKVRTHSSASSGEDGSETQNLLRKDLLASIGIEANSCHFVPEGVSDIPQGSDFAASASPLLLISCCTPSRTHVYSSCLSETLNHF